MTNTIRSTSNTSNRILRLPEVMHLTGRGRVSIYSDMKAGKFPKSIKIGARAVGWPQKSVEAWIASKLED